MGIMLIWVTTTCTCTLHSCLGLHKVIFLLVHLQKETELNSLIHFKLSIKQYSDQGHRNQRCKCIIFPTKIVFLLRTHTASALLEWKQYSSKAVPLQLQFSTMPSDSHMLRMKKMFNIIL